MKIVIVNSYFSFYGGSAVAAYDLYKLFIQKGHEVYFFATDRKPYFIENYEYAKYFPYELSKPSDYIKHPIRFYKNVDAKKNFEKLLDEIKPDIVHCHVLYQLTSTILDACYKRNIPVVKHLHDATIICPAFSLLKADNSLCDNVLCSGYKYWNCITNNCVVRNLEKSTRFALYNVFNQTKKHHSRISAFVTPSNAIKNLVVKSKTVIPAEKIHVINNFINSNTIKNTDEKQAKYFLFVGSLINIKGVQNILKAFEKLPQEIELHIVGSGKNEPDYKKFVSDRNMTNIKFLGYLDRADIENEYNNCIAVIQSSIFYEAFGLTVIEGFAHSKPVVAAQSGALPELVQNNRNGLTYSPLNTDELSDKILYLYKNPEAAMLMGKQARKDYLEKYTEESFYRSIIDVYNKVLER